MAQDGVVAEVIYPTFGLFIDMVPAADLQMACAQVYNDWLAESFLHRPDVFIPSAVVRSATCRRRAPNRARRRARLQSRDDPDDAARGHAVQPARLRPDLGRRIRSEDPAVAAYRHWHAPTTGTGRARSSTYAKVGLLSADTLCYFSASGVLERFPSYGSCLSRPSGLAYCCERMDEAFRGHRELGQPQTRAAAVALRQDTVLRDARCQPSPRSSREITGIEPLLWASDYPHPEGTFPESQAIVERTFQGVPEDEVQAIVGGNAARLYGVPRP